MSSTAYANVFEIQQQARASDAVLPQVWTDLSLAASRLFDTAAEAPENFFAPAGQTATAKTFYTDTYLIALPPYIENSITGVSVDDVAYTTEEDYFERGGVGRQYLEILTGVYSGYEYYTLAREYGSTRKVEVLARWGFEQTPADVKQAVIQIAIAMFRASDPAFQRISGAEGQIVSSDNLPPMARITAAKYKQQFSQFRGFA